MTTPRTSRGLDRLVNFSDATVAIAITLLILPLVDVASDIGRQNLGTVLHENSGALISFFITFAVIGRFWIIHHQLFEYVRAYSRPLIYANFLWLLGIVFLPFAANILSGSSGQPTSSAIYIGTMIVMTAASGLMDYILIHDPELTEPGAADALGLAGAVITVLMLALALVIAVVFRSVNLYALLLLLLSAPIARAYRRWADERHPAATIEPVAEASAPQSAGPGSVDGDSVGS